jgi:hypothetical protein
MVYSNYFSYKIIAEDKKTLIKVGISREYPEEIKKKNLFREKPTTFSQLRSLKMETFLKIRESDFKDTQGKWLTISSDFAIFMAGIELSCGRV